MHCAWPRGAIQGMLNTLFRALNITPCFASLKCTILIAEEGFVLWIKTRPDFSGQMAEKKQVLSGASNQHGEGARHNKCQADFMRCLKSHYDDLQPYIEASSKRNKSSYAHVMRAHYVVIWSYHEVKVLFMLTLCPQYMICASKRKRTKQMVTTLPFSRPCKMQQQFIIRT